MPTLTPVDSDPFAKKEAPPASPETQPKLTPVDHDPFAAKTNEGSEDTKQDDSFLGGMKRGFLERGTGVDTMLNQMGVGGMVPVFVNGRLTFGLPPNEELAAREEKLEEQGKGTGLKGSIAEFAGDPMSIMPGPSKLGLMAKGGIQAALSAFTAPTTNPEQTLGQRTADAAIATPFGMATGKGTEMVGKKLLGKNIPASAEMSKPSELYKTAQKMGLKFTGKEKPQEIYDAIQNAEKSKVGELADKVSPGASASGVSGIMTNLATSRIYGTVLAKNDVLYKKAEELGAKETTPVEGLADSIKAQIDDMEKDAPYQAANPKFGTTINTLKKMYEHISNGGEEALKEDPWTKIQRLLSEGGEGKTASVTGNHLIALDKALNENYGRTGGKGAGGRALTELQNKVQTAIQGMSPEFSKAYQAAKDDFRQNIVQNFRENPTLNKYWNEDDYYAAQALQKGISLPPELKVRANGILDEVKTFADLSEMKQHLDPATYDSVRAAKFVQLMNKAGLDASKLADEKNYAMIEKSLGDKPEDLAVLNAIKTFNDEMTRRGLEGKVHPVELAESDSRKDMAFRTIFSFLTGHKVYGFRHLVELIKGKQPEAIKGRLTGFAEDVAKGKPKPVYKPGVIPKVTTKVLSTEEGEMKE